MHSLANYIRSLTTKPDATFAAAVFDLVWRFDFDCPGFCLIDVGANTDSHALRRRMVELKNRLSALLQQRIGIPFCFRSMGRFDQQETTKFHLDGAPEQSMLILGYEPSTVVSRLFLADYSRAAFDIGITPQQYLHDFNPMFGHNEERLTPYITELPQPQTDHARILVINNSSLSFDEERRHPLGVMHKAILVAPDSSRRRIVNSTMLDLEGNDLAPEKQEEFCTTTGISEKFF
jgi:hypothetical protein